MIIQYYKGPAYVAKIQIKGKKVILTDSRYFPQGIDAEAVLAKDIEKKKKWRTRIKKMSEKEISEELKKDFKKMGLKLSSEVIHEQTKV